MNLVFVLSNTRKPLMPTRPEKEIEDFLQKEEG
jgi:hypothetical protein